MSASPALSQMVAGMERRAVAKASMARLRLPGVLAAPSPTTCRHSGFVRKTCKALLYQVVSTLGTFFSLRVHVSSLGQLDEEMLDALFGFLQMGLHSLKTHLSAMLPTLCGPVSTQQTARVHTRIHACVEPLQDHIRDFTCTDL